MSSCPKFVSWNVAKASNDMQHDVLAYILQKFGRGVILLLQETDNWGSISKHVAWELYHLEGQRTAIAVSCDISHVVSGDFILIYLS